jgi:hypothetical protein
MSRKVILSISILLILIEIGFITTVLKSGERQLAASVTIITTLAAQIRDYTRPLPKLGKLR